MREPVKGTYRMHRAQTRIGSLVLKQEGGIVMDDPTGGAWFVTNVYNNGIAGDDLRVLLGQFTTEGTFEGTLNYQVFLEGDGANDERVTVSFSSADLEGGDPAGLWLHGCFLRQLRPDCAIRRFQLCDCGLHRQRCRQLQ